MAKANKTTGGHCINVTSGKTSYVFLKSHNINFPDPAANTFSAVVKDINNDFTFTAFVVVQMSRPGRLALKLISTLPGGGGSPTDGLLTVTLTSTSISSGGNTTLPVSDVPVDYIDDPAGP
jgi:hypothetical protein